MLHDASLGYRHWVNAENTSSLEMPKSRRLLKSKPRWGIGFAICTRKNWMSWIVKRTTKIAVSACEIPKVANHKIPSGHAYLHSYSFVLSSYSFHLFTPSYQQRKAWKRDETAKQGHSRIREGSSAQLPQWHCAMNCREKWMGEATALNSRKRYKLMSPFLIIKSSFHLWKGIWINNFG